MLLMVISSISERHGISIAFPKQYRSIKELCTRRKDIFKVHTSSIPLPPTYFGTIDRQGSPLPSSPVCYLDIEQQLSSSLLQMSPDTFITNSTTSREDELFQGVETGYVYNNLQRAVQDKFKNDNYFPLMIGITLDETTLNSGRSKSTCPLLFYIMNQHVDDFKMSLLGYCPTKLPYSDLHLKNILRRRGFKTDVSMKTILKITKRQLQNDYIYKAIYPILQYQQQGFVVQIGQQNNSVTKIAVPFVVIISGDNLQLYKLSGTSSCTRRPANCRKTQNQGSTNQPHTPHVIPISHIVILE
jgi:hypothetical protein